MDLGDFALGVVAGCLFSTPSRTTDARTRELEREALEIELTDQYIKMSQRIVDDSSILLDPDFNREMEQLEEKMKEMGLMD
ncbi:MULTISPECIES: hypothetical protein [Pasteurellaceae]|uniref:Uncharacterized protein n=1 Tax=Pasteurella atlantica TaxID=2827233 RepID=A0AAW8CKC6_9PAST|nr:hypothetical protein [Pasteurella atlantica]MBR0573349.1 hypothetical protein [Pasteurella atlantica]MDP8040469.1 hypothetical protein [Pasteurella atlantica]MDP8041860.1 hypothetical protein [Pasteurella atlantica]MDP8043927.1 hypothetical protein [Pasteurella atlantica]MDP8046794.1 hypothetical protein [Pasteurella atlantica]